MPHEIPDKFLGTVQHQNARDLSKYLVHMTRTPESLAGIITSGQIEVGKSFGIAKYQSQVVKKHQSACFTEMPLTELDRLRDRGKPWGLAFERDFVLSKGGQRVWYVDNDRAPHKAVQAMMRAASKCSDWSNPVWELTPFIDLRDPAKYAFDWEREWRVVGGLNFQLEDVALVIGLDEIRPILEENIKIGAPFYSVFEDTYRWADDAIPEIGANMDVIESRFNDHFLTPDEAALPRDKDGYEGYFWSVRRWETQEALEELLPDAPSSIVDALAAHLNQKSAVWASREDVDAINL